MSESRIVCDYPYPVITVWRALTDPALVALWTSTGQGGRPEGFKTEVGTKFRYIGKPFPGWDGIVRCEVLAVDEPALLRYDWRNKETDQPTMVTNILAEIPGGTRLTWEHTGFHGIEGAFMSRLLGRVRRKMLTEGLPPVLADIGDDGRLRPGSTLSGPGQRVAPGRLISANLASGFHRCWPLRAGTRDLFALMQVRGTCHASSGGSGMAARNRVIAGPVGAVPADGCGLSDLLDPAYAIGERDREPLDLAEGWARRWVTRWQAGKSAVSCPVREMGEVLVSGCRPVRRFSWSTAQRHRPGLAAVVSTGRLHGFESLAEQRLLLALDFLGVVDLLAQPMALKFTTSSGRSSQGAPAPATSHG